MVQPDGRRVTLSALQELRLELDKGEAVTVRLLSGTAEVFGLELVLHADYPFGDEAKVAIFSWRGCDLEISLSASLFGSTSSRVRGALSSGDRKAHPRPSFTS
jgi:polyribonucleotide 5'-hydroxyl-kinase